MLFRNGGGFAKGVIIVDFFKSGRWGWLGLFLSSQVKEKNIGDKQKCGQESGRFLEQDVLLDF